MIRFHKEAAKELRASFDFYEKQRPGLGLRFLQDAESALEKVPSHPKAWPSLPPEKGALRRYLLRNFPFAVIYEMENQDLLIWAVMHLSRKPGYWKKRRADRK
jgi:hypothetical protein